MVRLPLADRLLEQREQAAELARVDLKHVPRRRSARQQRAVREEPVCVAGAALDGRVQLLDRLVPQNELPADALQERRRAALAALECVLLGERLLHPLGECLCGGERRLGRWRRRGQRGVGREHGLLVRVQLAVVHVPVVPRRRRIRAVRDGARARVARGGRIACGGALLGRWRFADAGLLARGAWRAWERRELCLAEVRVD